MTGKFENNNTIAPLRNVMAMIELINYVLHRDPRNPGMGVFYGPSGFGKTNAATFAANQFDAIQVQVKSVWTKKKFCQAILTEISIEPAKTISDMVDQISDYLARTGCVLLIDDAQYLDKNNAMEITRDIYESSKTPIILIGEETLPRTLAKWSNIEGRILKFEPAEPACTNDVIHLAKIYCPNVSIENDLITELLKASYHSLRRVCVNLETIKELAAIRNLKTVSKKDWGESKFLATTAPSPRRNLA